MNYLGLLGIGLGILTFVIFSDRFGEQRSHGQSQNQTAGTHHVAHRATAISGRHSLDHGNLILSKSVKTYMDDAIATTAQRLQAWLNGIFCSARLMMSGR